MHLFPFLLLPPGWGWDMEEGLGLWPNETNQRGFTVRVRLELLGCQGSLPPGFSQSSSPAGEQSVAVRQEVLEPVVRKLWGGGGPVLGTLLFESRLPLFFRRTQWWKTGSDIRASFPLGFGEEAPPCWLALGDCLRAKYTSS